MTRLGNAAGGAFIPDAADFLWHLDDTENGNIDFANAPSSTPLFNNLYIRKSLTP